jgi:hypothetical protein
MQVQKENITIKTMQEQLDFYQMKLVVFHPQEEQRLS